MVTKLEITFPFDADLRDPEKVALLHIAEKLCTRHMDARPKSRAFVARTEFHDDGATYTLTCAVAGVSSSGAALAVSLPLLGEGA